MKKNIVIALLLAACSGAQDNADGPDKTTEGGSASTSTTTSVDPNGAVVRLNEITSDEIADGTYAGAGDALEIVNIGMAAADLSGWKVSDDAELAADKTYVFPEGSTIMPGEYVVLVKLDDTTMMGDYPFGISSTDPESIWLVDGGGTVIDLVDFVGADASTSWCRLPDGDGDWQGCARTFGASNEPGVAESSTTDPSTEEGSSTDPSTDDTGVVAGPVVLNEISSSGDDPIEIYNAGPGDADLSGWTLTDDLAAPNDPYDPDADLEKLVFAEGTMLAAGEWLVVIKGMTATDHPFGLSADGDAVTLLDADLQIVDFSAYGAMAAATSYCRIPDGPDGEWQADCAATFGDANAQ
ncbi:MAG TPA: lamin tail domain-containing protein [Nannocystaceae bacterium]|nr:lamin tail domain-containing protein [Nannocystaceae bacterium]